MKKSVNIIWGVLLILVGIIIALNSLNITNIDLFFDGWWTLFIIIPCFIDLFDGDDLSGSIIGIIIGVALLLCCQGIITMDIIWKLSLPLIFIIAGILVIFKGGNHKIKAIANKDDLQVYCATFGSQKVDLSNQKFKGANVAAIFGNVDMNLNETTMNKTTVIYATSIFGSIMIDVPNDIKVEVNSIPIFGGVTNKRKNPKDSEAKTLYIKGVSIFGGIEVK